MMLDNCHDLEKDDAIIAAVEANALLIAAAPELLAALQALLSRVSNDADAKGWFLYEQEKARAAIAKATGEQE